jgi:hypothetical protein
LKKRGKTLTLKTAKNAAQGAAFFVSLALKVKVWVKPFQRLVGWKGQSPFGLSFKKLSVCGCDCAVVLLAVVVPSEEADAVQACEGNESIYYAAYDAFHAAKNGGDKVESEKTYQPPVDCAEDNKCKANVVPSS